MKQSSRTWMLIWLLFFTVSACSNENELLRTDSKTAIWHSYKVAVVLPMEQGLNLHWKRTIELLTKNVTSAFGDQTEGIRIEFEWYNELSVDLAQVSKALAERDDVVAVIGGMYSKDARIMAAPLSKAGKPFFTIATTAELVRAYADGGNLWAMTETDITQCEVLLSKALYYGADSVALIAKDGDPYGKTFIDWFAFQAEGLGLGVKGVFQYNDSNLVKTSEAAAASKADYLICVASDIADIKPMADAVKKHALEYGSAPKTLFSDGAYGASVVQIVGQSAEGLEGVTFGADPESGFDVSYEAFFGEQPTLGEAQIYDSGMLLSYALYYRLLHPEASLKEALRQIVSGREANRGSWMAEDMRLVVNALADGKHPDVRGASGSLDFDAKVYTNVLRTTYYNFKLYNGRYIILDYNTSDGSKRTDATLAGWNWKTSQMQEFTQSTENVVYPPLKSRWALLVSASKGWENYRHQADVLAMYQDLKKRGYTDDHIILIVQDDLAYNARNPQQGELRVRMGGENVYKDLKIDYKTSDLHPEDIYSILNGEKSERLPQVVESTENDNVLIFWSGHGYPGELCWLDDVDGFTTALARKTFSAMSRNKRYRKVLCLTEACYSGSVMQSCEGLPGALFLTAANPWETSKADVYNEDLGVWMSNRFTATLQDQLAENPTVPLYELYYRLFINTVGSHVMVYNAARYGNIYKDKIDEFL